MCRETQGLQETLRPAARAGTDGRQAFPSSELILGGGETRTLANCSLGSAGCGGGRLGSELVSSCNVMGRQNDVTLSPAAEAHGWGT